jgi:hypothetical protein
LGAQVPLPTVWISFDLFEASFDLRDITGQLGIEPTSAHRTGDPIKEDQGRWPRDRWRITIGPRNTIEIGNMLDELVTRLRPAEQALRGVYDANKVEAMITCAVEPQSGVTPYILFPNEVVQWAAAHDVALAVDVMLWREEED